MSMPSSSELVATTAGSWPDFSASSMCLRSSRETLPWWARATTGAAPVAIADCAMHLGRQPSAADPRGGAAASTVSARAAAISLSRAQSRSASRRELAKTIVDRCAVIRS